MQVKLLKSKILRATVTESSVDYEGSLGIDIDFMKQVGILPYEHILVGDITNGSRFETYAIPAPSGSKTIALNGAVAHLSEIGNKVVIMSFANLTPDEIQDWKPKVITLAEGNSKIINSVNVEL